MSDQFGKQWAEKCQESLDNDPVHYMTDSVVALEDFVVFVEDKLHPKQFEDLLNEWLKTAYAKKWYEQTLDQLVRDCPENEDDWRIDR